MLPPGDSSRARTLGDTEPAEKNAARAAPIDIDRLEREDLVLFINACFACTGQSEFYAAADGQRLSIDFLHEYVLGNYRRLYALTLAAGINHFNQAQIIERLLAAGAPAEVDARREEGALLAAATDRLPPQRVFRLIDRLRHARVNNRRTRAVIRDWLRRRPDHAFDAVKYRGKLRAAARHVHLRFARVGDNAEIGPFVFAADPGRAPAGKRAWKTPLLDSFRRAHYSRDAVYELPYTVAEGFAARHRIPRERFLAGIQPRMTAAERNRLEQAGRRAGAALTSIDLARMPLTRLALYILSRPDDERVAESAVFGDALGRAAERALRRAPLRLGRVCAVLDRSFSSRGSSAKANRPLAVALGAHALLERAATWYRGLWTARVRDPLRVTARGQTDLATPLLAALRERPELIVIISDGFENDPPGAVSELIRVFRQRIERAGEPRTSIVHLNPVFDSERYAPRALSADVATVGLRDAEDLPTALGFARFAVGAASLADLEGYLVARAADLLGARARTSLSGTRTQAADGELAASVEGEAP